MYGAIDSDDYDWFEPSEARPLDILKLREDQRYYDSMVE